MTAAPRGVPTQQVTILARTLHWMPAPIKPVPKMAPTTAWLVETGSFLQVMIATVMAAANIVVKPWKDVCWVKPLKVWRPSLPSRRAPMITKMAVKIAAVRLLRGLGSSTTLSPLTACLQTCQGNLKEEIIQTLASLEDRGVLSTLHAILEDEEPRIKEAAIEALKRFRDNASISHLVALSSDPSESVRLAAATSLRGYDQKACKEVIVNHLRASDPEAVCFGLDMIPEDLSAKFKRDILPLCNHKDDAVRKRAVEHASFLRDDTAFETVARSLVDDMPQVRLAGIRGLEHCRGREVANLLLKVVGSDPEKWNRYEAVNTIGRLRLLNVIPSLVSLLESAPDLVKTGILDVVGALGNSKYVETIEAYVDAENDEVGRAAAEALERLRVQAT